MNYLMRVTSKQKSTLALKILLLFRERWEYITKVRKWLVETTEKSCDCQSP